MTRSKWWLPLDFVLILPLLGMLILFGIALAYDYRIVGNPETAVGVVSEKLAYTRGGEQRFDYRYDFTAASGGEYRGVIGADRGTYAQTSIGDPIEIAYAADAPEYKRVTSATRGPFFIIAAIGGAITVLLPLVALAWGAIRRLSTDLRAILT